MPTPEFTTQTLRIGESGARYKSRDQVIEGTLMLEGEEFRGPLKGELKKVVYVDGTLSHYTKDGVPVELVLEYPEEHEDTESQT